MAKIGEEIWSTKNSTGGVRVGSVVYFDQTLNVVKTEKKLTSVWIVVGVRNIRGRGGGFN